MTCHQPNEDLLLVIDMQNVYTDGQPWACCGVEQAADAIRRLLDEQVCGQVMFTRFLPPENPVGVWAEYNQVNAGGKAGGAACPAGSGNRCGGRMLCVGYSSGGNRSGASDCLSD